MSAVKTIESFSNSSVGSGIRSIVVESELSKAKDETEKIDESAKVSKVGSNFYREVRLSTNETLISRSAKKTKKVPVETCRCIVI